MNLEDAELSEVLHELTSLTSSLKEIEIRIQKVREKILLSIKDIENDKE